ncbi:MAG: hypothetical protein Kow00124_23380 [Anaerolineae bacterium]
MVFQRMLNRVRLAALSRADWLALALITLVAALFFAPVWAGGGWLPYGGGDLASLLWPNMVYGSRMLKAGQLPLWTPHLFGGMPFWADNQTAVLYPPNLAVMLLTDVPYAALEGLVVFHIWLAGAAMYACLRLIEPEGFGPAPAALGAVAWMLSDVFVTHIGNLNLNAAAAWLPLVFLGAWRGLRDRSVGWALLAGAAFGLGLLAGHAQMSYYTALTVAAIAAWHAGSALIGGGQSGAERLRAALAVIGLAALIAAAGLAIGAAGWLPTLELAGQTGRATLSYEQAAAYSLPPRALIGLIWPGFYGRGPRDFTGDWDRVEVGYMGALALTLALAGAVIGLRQRRALAIFLAALGVSALLLAFGSYFPLHRLAYEILPGLDQIRVPARFVLLFNFAGAALAALALQAALTRWPQHATLTWGAALITAAELILNGAWVEVQYTNPLAGFDHPEALAWLAGQPGAPAAPYRIDSLYDGWQPHTAQIVPGLFDIYGFSQPLALSHYETYYWSVGYRGSPQYDFLGAKYVIGGDEPPGDASFVAVHSTPGGPTIYLNTGALPLAHLVYRAESVRDQADYWEAIHSPDWDPTAQVFVHGGPALNGPAPSGFSLAFRDYQPNRIELLAVTPQPAYLVLSEVDYPGWRASVDGQPAPIYRANIAFRAVYLSTPGEHRVVLTFRPTTVYVGLDVSLVSLPGLAGYAVWRGRRRGSGQRQAEQA